MIDIVSKTINVTAYKLDDFEMTKEGCVEAENYLVSIGKYEEFTKNKASTDGFSLVAFANSVKQKLRNTNSIGVLVPDFGRQK